MRNLLTVAAACLRVLGHARSHYQEEKRRVGGGLPADYASLSSRRTWSNIHRWKPLPAETAICLLVRMKRHKLGGVGRSYLEIIQKEKWTGQGWEVRVTSFCTNSNVAWRQIVSVSHQNTHNVSRRRVQRCAPPSISSSRAGLLPRYFQLPSSIFQLTYTRQGSRRRLQQLTTATDYYFSSEVFSFHQIMILCSNNLPLPLPVDVHTLSKLTLDGGRVWWWGGTCNSDYLTLIVIVG